MKIKDLYFGISKWDFNHKTVVQSNLFANLGVLRSVALYVTSSEEAKERIEDPLKFCFGDTWSRCEWELMIDGFPESGNSHKYDIYTLFVLPNAEYLLSLVEQVDVKSAREFLKEMKK